MNVGTCDVNARELEDIFVAALISFRNFAKQTARVRSFEDERM